MLFKIVGWIIVMLAFLVGMYSHEPDIQMPIISAMGWGLALLIAGYGSSIEDKLKKR